MIELVLSNECIGEILFGESRLYSWRELLKGVWILKLLITVDLKFEKACKEAKGTLARADSLVNLEHVGE